MNPMVAQQLKQIAENIDELKEELLAAQDQIETLTQSKDELQTKSWSQAKEIAVYKEGLEELPELRLEYQRLDSQNKEFEQRLRRILQYTRALSSAFYP